MSGWHGLFEQAARELSESGDKQQSTLFVHGTLKVLLYAPRKVDHQVPHDRDEVYAVVRGSGVFKLGDNRFAFKEGDVIFVPAGVQHRFEEFTDNLATWVFFYGPTGGEEQDGA